MDHNLFYERLKAEVKKERDEYKENLALGYAGDDHRYFIGMIRGMDDVDHIAQRLLRAINNGD